ncbi:MAG TPA: hypothetical protein ENK44_03990 [Caldithrix abyssi]|uniref:Uncharacterized protein n=1 Tax=Caldithrix abyssi TaxID=187145 RepID=A0A7V4WUW1_CALAY|nr:hypothetical protein [Caldithrix abyssi]
MPFTMVHEDILPFFGVNCQCELEERSLPQPLPGLPTTTGWAPTNIIQTGQNWRVQFDWNTIGPLNYYMAGTWHLRVYLEKMGGGEFTLPSANKTVNFVSAPHHYSNEYIEIPGGTVPAGIYKLVTAITMKGPGGIPGPIAMFGEGPMVQFYDVGP